MRDHYERRAVEATEKVQRILGGRNYWYEYELGKGFKFMEKRGPLRTMVMPVEISGRYLPEIPNFVIEMAIRFVRRQRGNEDYFMKHKQYKQFTRPDEYVDPRSSFEKDESGWVDSSPKVDGVTKVSVPA